MQTIKSFRDLLVWQKAMDLCVRTCVATRRFGRQDAGELGHQARKAAVSIPSNIAEGFSRHSTAHYIQHLWTAFGSSAELETQIELAGRLGLLDAREAELLTRDAQEIARMLHGLVRGLQRGTPVR